MKGAKALFFVPATLLSCFDNYIHIDYADFMKILFLGDIVGRAARQAIVERLPKIRENLNLDFVIVNGENCTGGMGLSGSHAKMILDAGADVITLGDHSFDQKDMMSFAEAEKRIIRPLNYAKSAPGRGHGIFSTKNHKKILVIQALGQVFMRSPFADPFGGIDHILKAHKLGGSVDAIFVDFHAEATSEKMAMGIWLDGRVSAVVGTHTHVPTADAMILPSGTGYQSDAGMCGDYHSVIGMNAEEPLRRFITGMSKTRFEPALGEVTLSGVFVETDDKGRAKICQAFRDGGHLSPAMTSSSC